MLVIILGQKFRLERKIIWIKNWKLNKSNLK